MLSAECNGKRYIPYLNSEDFEFTLKNKDNFICPHCKADVTFINGKVVIRHFRHNKESNCNYEPETKDHLEMKSFFYEKYKSFNPELEYKTGNNIADIYVKDFNLAIEVQCSKISLEDFKRRNDSYKADGVNVIWIFNQRLLSEYLSELFRYITTKNFGRVYFYHNRNVFPVYYLPMWVWIEYGGYWKKNKKKKKLHIGENINNFNIFLKEEFEFPRFFDKYPEKVRIEKSKEKERWLRNDKSQDCKRE